MDAHIRIMLEHLSSNARKAIINKNPDLTLAFLVNLYSVLPSYIEKANHDANHQEQETKYGKLRKASK
jgi:hypothetical protein